MTTNNKRSHVLRYLIPRKRRPSKENGGWHNTVDLLHCVLVLLVIYLETLESVISRISWSDINWDDNTVSVVQWWFSQRRCSGFNIPKKESNSSWLCLQDRKKARHSDNMKKKKMKIMFQNPVRTWCYESAKSSLVVAVRACSVDYLVCR